jgi:hypothetical protein
MSELEKTYRESLAMPPYNLVKVEELDESIRKQFQNYKSDLIEDTIEELVESGGTEEEVKPSRTRLEMYQDSTNTWELEIGFLGYQMGNKRVSDTLLGNTLVVQCERRLELKRKNIYDAKYDPFKMFVRGFVLAHPKEDENEVLERCGSCLKKQAQKERLLDYINDEFK